MCMHINVLYIHTHLGEHEFLTVIMGSQHLKSTRLGVVTWQWRREKSRRRCSWRGALGCWKQPSNQSLFRDSLTGGVRRQERAAGMARTSVKGMVLSEENVPLICPLNVESPMALVVAFLCWLGWKLLS